MKAKLKEKRVDFDRECLIYEVCNPQQAKQVLEVNPEISTALPCRIAIYPEGNSVTLSTIRPTALIAMFKTPELKALAEEVETVLVKFINDLQGRSDLLGLFWTRKTSAVGRRRIRGRRHNASYHRGEP